MNKRGYIVLFAFAALMLIVGLACAGLGGSPSSPPPTQTRPQTQPPVSTTAPTEKPGNALVTFTDENKLYAIDIPGDWKYKQTRDNEKNYYYIDTFTSPDGNAVVENIVYDDGTYFRGSDEGKFGLYLLNTFYSKTGKEGDIRVTEEKQQSDGSDRLTWYSKAGGYSGISYLEVRNNGTTFMMFTVNWGDDFKDQYFDMLDSVISSYRVP